MDEGSGDGSQMPQTRFNCSDIPLSKDLISASHESEALQKCIENLRLEAKTEQSWDSENTADGSSSSEESDVEPICSYPYGYIKRQTVYICLTCNDPTKENWKPAGICIGCRYACHQDHEIISMETRRSFRCDCGNKKFPDGSCCILYPDKEVVNEQNIYNNNYKGTFCTCHCKEADCGADDPLYQCVVCEDWFHSGHCNAKTEGIEKNYTDLICGVCTTKLEFLRYYDPFDANKIVDDKAISEMMKYSEIDVSEDEIGDDKVCKLTTLVKKDPYATGQLWTLGWRGQLCRCTKCKEMYASLNVSFLLDKEDETRRYFSEDEEEETQNKICILVRKFEEWLFQMEPQERTELFQLEPDDVKQKMKEYFAKMKNEGDTELLFDDQLLDQLFDSFAEFILDAEGGADYLLDVDALEKVFGGGVHSSLEGAEEDNSNNESHEEKSSSMV